MDIPFDQLTYTRCFSEFFGTIFLTVFTCIGCVNCENQYCNLFFGYVTVTIVHCFGYVSGGHTNPNVTLACKFMTYMPWSLAIKYMISQIVGALVGYYFLTLMLPHAYVYERNPPLGVVVPNKVLSVQQAFAIEFILTTALILTWTGVWHRRQACIVNSKAMRIGGVIAACYFLGRSLATGVSLNAATLLAPAIFQKNFKHLFVYLSAQLLATLTCVSAYNFFAAAAKNESKPIKEVSRTALLSEN